MALPTLTKTWQHNVNNAIAALGSALADNRRLLRSIKNALVGFGTNPWTVRYSSSSAVAGTAGDGVDRWSADSDLVWAAAASAHSWIVLRQTGIATNYEVCFSLEGASATGVAMLAVVSFSAGFTGGSTTARPTATDEQIFTLTNWSGNGADVASRWSVMQSTDGQCTRVLVCISGSVTLYWIMDRPANPSTGWANPSVSFFVQAAQPTSWPRPTQLTEISRTRLPESGTWFRSASSLTPWACEGGMGRFKTCGSVPARSRQATSTRMTDLRHRLSSRSSAASSFRGTEGR